KVEVQLAAGSHIHKRGSAQIGHAGIVSKNIGVDRFVRGYAWPARRKTCSGKKAERRAGSHVIAARRHPIKAIFPTVIRAGRSRGLEDSLSQRAESGSQNL